MPKVKYLKDLCSGRAGTVRELRQYEVNVLLKLKAVELIDLDGGTAATEAQAAATEAHLLDLPESVLRNLNGTPVVGDFGDIALKTEQKDIIPAPAGRKNSKK
ncbi:hypothetical protein [Acinetobacter chinensis]|nr:hypothetical protein [Acinetobacter chinensis]